MIDFRDQVAIVTGTGRGSAGCTRWIWPAAVPR